MVSATIELFRGTEDEPVLETAFGIIVDPGGNAASEGILGSEGLDVSRGEARWHGCCLALAEMARRGLVKGETLGQSVQWATKVSQELLVCADKIRL